MRKVSGEVCFADGDVIVFGFVAASSDLSVLTCAQAGDRGFGVDADCLVRSGDAGDSVASGEPVGGHGDAHGV
jgi:hypothetical protein